jgi:hypothetical protein
MCIPSATSGISPAASSQPSGWANVRRRGQADLRPPLPPDGLDPGSAGGLMHRVTSLTIVYDASGRLGTRLIVWIVREPSAIRLPQVLVPKCQIAAK